MSKTLHAQSSEIDIWPGKSSDVISVNMKLTATIFCMNTQKRSIEEQEMLNHLKKTIGPNFFFLIIFFFSYLIPLLSTSVERFSVPRMRDFS